MNELKQTTYSKLNSWQKTAIARHQMRFGLLDFVEHATTDFLELHGDRTFADDLSIIGGLARLDNISVMMIGHQKGRNTKENLIRNFGMPRPEGYRKAQTLSSIFCFFSSFPKNRRATLRRNHRIDRMLHH